jgi:hypothetical protein
MLPEIPDYSAPNIMSIYPEDNTTDFTTRDTIEIMFDQRMDRTSTEQAFSIVPNVSGKLFWMDQDQKLMFFPTVPFEQETMYRVGVTTSAKSVYDTNLEEEFVATFTTGTATNSNVVEAFPADGAEGVSNVPDIMITFDARMNTITTQNAFSIMPDLNGSLSWNDGFDTLYFHATSPGEPGETYTVTLDQSARTYYGGFLLNDFSFSFTTRSKLNLIDHYPRGGETDIAPSVLIKLEFELPINSGSLPGNIYFYDEQDNFIQVSVDQSAYSKGFIEFEAVQPLHLNSTYRVILKEGIADIENVPLNEEVVIEFTTESTTYTDGDIKDDFENIDNWQNPLLSPNTIGVDPELTTLTLSGVRNRSESNAGLLEYMFIDSEGTIELAHQPQIELGSDDNTELGIWVFGDYSSNLLEYWFEDNQSNIIKTEIDTINWTGWRIKSIQLGDIGGSAPYKLSSIVVKKSSAGKSSGTLYFDDVQVDFITPVTGFENSLPDQFRLAQNYPNPFNPATTINYSIPAVEKGNAKSLRQVTLVVYDMLGREVATLVNEKQSPGLYSAEFDASSLASGIYFYKLKAGKFINTKKMLLLK